MTFLGWAWMCQCRTAKKARKESGGQSLGAIRVFSGLQSKGPVMWARDFGACGDFRLKTGSTEEMASSHRKNRLRLYCTVFGAFPLRSRARKETSLCLGHGSYRKTLSTTRGRAVGLLWLLGAHGVLMDQFTFQGNTQTLNYMRALICMDECLPFSRGCSGGVTRVLISFTCPPSPGSPCAVL